MSKNPDGMKFRQVTDNLVKQDFMYWIYGRILNRYHGERMWSLHSYVKHHLDVRYTSEFGCPYLLEILWIGLSELHF